MKPEQKAKPEKKLKKVKVTKKKGNSTLIIGIIGIILLAAIAYAILSGGSQTKETKTGMTLKAFREQIDTEYLKKGYSGTNTPPVRDDYTPILSPRKADKLPDYVYTNAMTLKAYEYAAEYPGVLEQMSCYCGCGQHGSETSEGRPHRFLRDCFINDKGMYDSHASTCDVCIGIAIRSQSLFPSGITKLSSAGQPPSVISTPSVDLSALSLPDNFKSLSDGLKLIPQGITWVYFTNLKQGVGIEQNSMEPMDFYGTLIIGMLNAEYQDGSWIELHDVGKSNAMVKSNAGANVDNILFTRPYIFATKDKTNAVLALFNNPTNANAYNSYRSLLGKVDDEEAGFAKINTKAPDFADVSYFGIAKSGNDVKGEIAFNVTNRTVSLTKYNELKDSSAARGFKSYEVKKENNTLIIRMTSNLNNIISEATQNYGIEI